MPMATQSKNGRRHIIETNISYNTVNINRIRERNMANAIRLPEQTAAADAEITQSEVTPMKPRSIIIAGIILTALSAGYSWMMVQSLRESLSAETYFGPEIGTVRNPLTGKLVTDGEQTVRVDRTDDEKSIIVTPIRTDEDRQAWLADQRDRSPEPVTLTHNSGQTLAEAVQLQTITFTAEHDQAARAKFDAQQGFVESKRPIRYMQATVPPALGLGVLIVGIVKAVRRR